MARLDRMPEPMRSHLAALPGSAAFNCWFWSGTAAGRVLKAVKARCASENDEALRMTGAMLLIPAGQT